MTRDAAPVSNGAAAARHRPPRDAEVGRRGRAPARQVAALAVVALLAVAPTTTIALRESWWYDECLTLRVMTSGSWWDDYVATESSPPAYFGLAHFAFLATDGWAGAARAVSILAHAAAVMLMVAWAARRLGRTAAVVATSYALLHPLALWYGFEARPYALLLLATTGLTLTVADLAPPVAAATPPRASAAPGSGGGGGGEGHDGEAGEGRRLAVRFAAWSLLAMATHYFAAFFVAVASLLWGGLLLAAPRATPTRPRHWIAAHAALGLAALPLLLLLRAQLAGGHTDYIAAAPLQDLGRTFLVVFPFGLDAAIWRPLRAAGALAMGGLLLAAFARVALASASSRPPIDAPDRTDRAADVFSHVAAIVLLVAPPTLLFLFSIAVRPVYLYDRYPIMSLPALWLMVALLASSAGATAATSPPWRAVRAVLLAVLLACAATQCVRYLVRDEPFRTPWRDLATMVRVSSASSDPPLWIPDPADELCVWTNLGGGIVPPWAIDAPPRGSDLQHKRWRSMELWALDGLTIARPGTMRPTPAGDGDTFVPVPVARLGDREIGRITVVSRVDSGRPPRPDASASVAPPPSATPPEVTPQP